METPIATEVSIGYVSTDAINIPDAIVYGLPVYVQPVAVRKTLRQKGMFIAYLYFTYICISLVIISMSDILWTLYWAAFALTLLDMGLNLPTALYYILSIIQFIACYLLISYSNYGLVWVIILIDVQLVWGAIKFLDWYRMHLNE